MDDTPGQAPKLLCVLIPLFASRLGQYGTRWGKICRIALNASQYYSDIPEDITHIRLFFVIWFILWFYNAKNISHPEGIQNSILRTPEKFIKNNWISL